MKETNAQQHLESERYTYSQLVALFLILSFFIFMVGFYWGKKVSSDAFVDQVASDALTDKVSYAFCSLYDYDSPDEEAPDASLDQNIPQAKNDIIEVPQKILLHTAQIAGFGTQKAAIACMENLKNNGFAVTINPKKSRTSKGKEITWYQVVTEPVEDKEQLLKLVSKIKKIAHVKEIPIVTVEKSNKP